MTGVPRVVGGMQVAQAGICVECCPTANVGGAKVSAAAGVLSPAGQQLSHACPYLGAMGCHFAWPDCSRYHPTQHTQ